MICESLLKDSVYWVLEHSTRFYENKGHEMGPTVFHPKGDLSSHLQMTLQRQRF